MAPIERIVNLLRRDANVDWKELNEQSKLQIILDCSKMHASRELVYMTSVLDAIECETRRLCYSLHCRRTYLMDRKKSCK